MAGPLIVRQGNRPLSISFESDIAMLERELPRWASERIPSITRNALNDTAPEAREAERQKIRGVFDRPTPLTERSPLYTRATKERLVVEVFIRDELGRGTPPARYLRPQVEGGGRPHKRFEVALLRMGIMLPGEYALPAAGYRRDQYGNLPGPTIVQMLSQLRAFAEVGFSMNETARSRKRAKRGRPRYFVPEGVRVERGISRLPRGIYERQGNRIRAVVVFVRAPSYRKRYDFGQAAIAKAERVFFDYWRRHFYAELQRKLSN